MTVVCSSWGSQGKIESSELRSFYKPQATSRLVQRLIATDTYLEYKMMEAAPKMMLSHKKIEWHTTASVWGKTRIGGAETFFVIKTVMYG